MKRSIEALVRWTAAAAVVAAAVGTAAAAAQAATPVVALSGEAALARADGTREARFHVRVGFATEPADAEPFTIQRAVVLFPDRAGTNGRLFPSCDAARIARLRGNVARCPRGAQIGSGTVEATAIQLGVTARGYVTVLNSGGGRSVTFNIRTYLPAAINESIDAPLVRRRGPYGERLTLAVPHALQEIIPGVFVAVRSFDVTLGGSVRVRGRDYSYMRARTCPTLPMRGIFDFRNWTTGETATATAEATVRCRAG